MVARLEEADQTSSKLSRRIAWLTFWLLLFTIAIFALTAVLVLSELKLWPFNHVVTGPGGI